VCFVAFCVPEATTPKQQPTPEAKTLKQKPEATKNSLGRERTWTEDQWITSL
jgi:hypothetical protein